MQTTPNPSQGDDMRQGLCRYQVCFQERLPTLVIAAVRVVFPWSTCPMVPTFKCGFVRELMS